MVAAAVLLGIGLGLLNSAAGFDSIDRQRGLFWCQVGDSLRTVGRQAESVDPYRKGLALTPENAVGAANLGRVLIQLGRRNEAIAYLSQAVRYDPANTAVRCELGQALLAENRPDDALQQLQEVLRRDPKMVFAHIGVSQILYASGDIRGGIAALRRAQELAPESPDLANDLAWLLATTPGLSETEHAGAVHIAQQALAKIGDKDPGVLDTLAAALASDGRFTEAVAAMEQALARAQEQGDSDKVERFRQRLELYKSGQPYLAPPPRPGP